MKLPHLLFFFAHKEATDEFLHGLCTYKVPCKIIDVQHVFQELVSGGGMMGDEISLDHDRGMQVREDIQRIIFHQFVVDSQDESLIVFINPEITTFFVLVEKIFLGERKVGKCNYTITHITDELKIDDETQNRMAQRPEQQVEYFGLWPGYFQIHDMLELDNFSRIPM